MTTVQQDKVSAERVIAADASAIFDVLADPSKHPLIDGSGTLQHPRGDASRLALGSRFGMAMRNGVPYRVRPRVVEFEEGRRVAWRNTIGPTWRYELFPDEGGTLVRETYDWGGTASGIFLRHSKRTGKTLDNMTKTLERLELVVTGQLGAE